MSWLIGVLLVLGGWAQYAPPPAAQGTDAPPVRVYEGYITAYSCDAVSANSMHPCGLFRDGTRPDPALHGTVAACPLEWVGAVVEVEGYGVVMCRDTPRTAWYGDVVHIDLFLSFDDALQWGARERRVWKTK